LRWLAGFGLPGCHVGRGCTLTANRRRGGILLGICLDGSEHFSVPIRGFRRVSSARGARVHCMSTTTTTHPVSFTCTRNNFLHTIGPIHAGIVEEILEHTWHCPAILYLTTVWTKCQALLATTIHICSILGSIWTGKMLHTQYRNVKSKCAFSGRETN
jgi:hypothetical protein